MGHCCQIGGRVDDFPVQLLCPVLDHNEMFHRIVTDPPVRRNWLTDQNAELRDLCRCPSRMLCDTKTGVC